MSVFVFPCPHCSIPLRMKDRGLVGQTIVCPDCSGSISISVDGHGTIVGEPAVSPLASETKSSTLDESRLLEPLLTWTSQLTTPVGIAWIVAACLSIGIVAWMTYSPREKAGSESTADDSISDPATVVPKLVNNEDSPDEPEQRSPEDQLTNLFEEFSSYHQATGEWPAGTAGDDSLPDDARFSWLALLAAHSNPNGPQPRWDRAWNAPANDRFVRQRQDRLLNPAVPRKTGNDGYPASHLVGITGVGADAAVLPAAHPRAGIFGKNRVTTLEDVSDGLGNTMLVAGVESDLGSWAASGRSTMRGLTAEPYVNGPDGFGTGESDGMLVLMADGSTRILSSKTDPVLLRRMAAKSDGLPLDATIVGEPGMTDANPPEQPAEAKPALDDVKDIVAELAEPIDNQLVVPVDDEGPGIDLVESLAQPIVIFEQKQPIASGELLLLLEEMVGVKIDKTSLPKDVRSRLDQPVTIRLENTTVGDILTELLQQVRLSYVVGTDQLELTEKPIGSD